MKALNLGIFVVFQGRLHKQIKSDNINAVNNAHQQLQIIDDADMPD